ncbi:hypothetical protein F511_34604 [Dorcoceras hygrometricum]|uniref:Uncharacterized protein n=1 Tax=Dorcoceras hygrometricum TaxID=472368 RepID=A0A2Z7CSX6_9LAMI|nr:hypothetical protein F511_34604 [Dorcoceras hygrometricum]
MNGQICLHGAQHGQLRLRGVQSVAELLKEQVTVQRREVADEDRTAMMTSAVMSSQSAVDRKRKRWISDDDVISDVITISNELH